MFKFQRQRAEKPRDRVDFKFFQFEASKVPVSCDKLLVTIISVETGKAVARTNKALVRSASCQWSEAVSESVLFLQDDTSKELEEKLFKFVVSTGSPRSGIVGEATINLADYLSSKAPVSLSLPLKKCNHGTILHVKIHCLSPRVGSSRKTEHLRESTVELDDQNSVSDDMDNRSEGSDHIIAGSVGSSSGNRLGRGVLHNKDGASSPSSSRFSSDSGEILSSGSSIANGNNLHQRQDSAGSRDSSATNRSGNGHDLYKLSPSSPFNGKGSGSVINLQKQWNERSAQGTHASVENVTRASLTRGSDPSKGSLEAAEATIHELRTEAMMWERKALKLEADMEALKHQFAEQTKQRSGLEVEFSAARAERDGLRLEVEQLKSALEASTERESAINSTIFEANDAKHIIEELKEEIKIQKQSNADLDLQLRKTQESNMDLVSALQELEETIQQQNIELDKFSDEREKLHDLEAIKQEYEEMRLHTESSSEVESVKCAIQRLQEELEIEKASNNDLNLQLQKREESYNQLVSITRELEQKVKIKDMEIEHLSDAMKRFELSSAEQKQQSIDTDAEWMPKLSVTDGKGCRKESSEDLRIALEKYKREIDELERDCKELTDENVELIFKMKRINEYLESKDISMDDLEEKVSQNDHSQYRDGPMIIKKRTSKDETEINELKSQVSELELEMKSSEKSHAVELASMEASLNQFKNEVLELQNQNSGLEMHLRSLKDRICYLETELEMTEQQQDSYSSREKHQLGKVHQLELENAELQSEIQELKEEQCTSRSTKEELGQELGRLTSSMESQISAKRNLEKKVMELESTKEELEMHLTDLEVENVQLSERISGLEAQLRYMTEERETYRLDLENAKSYGIELETKLHRLEHELRGQNVELQKNLDESEIKLAGALEHTESYKRDHQQLQLKLDSLMKEYAESKASLEEETLNLSASHAKLEVQLLEVRDRFSYSTKQVTSLESELATLQKYMAEKERVWSVEIEALHVINKENEQKVVQAEDALNQLRLEKEAMVQNLENEVQRLTEQMSSTHDEKEEMASKALIEASELRAEKLRLEDSLRQMHGKVRHYEMELSSVRQDCESNVQELALQITVSKEKEEELNSMHEAAVNQLDHMKHSEEKSRQRLQELEKKIQHIDTEKQKLRDEHAILSSQAEEVANLRNTVDDIRSEKSRLESSLQLTDIELGKLKAERTSLVEKVAIMQAAVSEVDSLKRSKAGLEEKLLRFQAELSAKEASSAYEAEHKNESLRLRRVNSQFQRKIQDIEEEREEFKNRIKLLEDELKLKTDSLSKAEQKVHSESNSKIGYTSPSSDTKEVAELRERLRFAEGELATLVKDFQVKERDLSAKIRYLENVNKQVKPAQGDLGGDNLQLEITKLQDRNSSLSHREHELLSKQRNQEQLQKEVEKLQESNKQLLSQLSRFKETAKSGDSLYRVVALETELAEALESNAMYKSQLQSFLSQDQNVHVAALQNFGTVDQVVNDLTRFKRTSSSLETELKDLRERYFRMSLQFAEVEAQREELVMQIKNLKSGRKWF